MALLPTGHKPGGPKCVGVSVPLIRTKWGIEIPHISDLMKMYSCEMIDFTRYLLVKRQVVI